MRIYKFLPSNFALEDLRKRQLKITILEDLNDPFDLLPFDLCDPTERTAFEKSVLQVTCGNRRGLLCFSASWENPVVWAHYADRHAGICLGFEIPDEKVKEVDYVETKIKLPRPLRPTEDMAQQLLFTKFCDWRYEHEWRGWATLDEMQDGHFFIHFGKDTLELVEVIMGCRCPVRATDIAGVLIGYDRIIVVRRAASSADSYRMVEDLGQTFAIGAAEAGV